MTDVTLHFDLDPKADVAATVRELEQSLGQLNGVAAATTSQKETRFTGVEIVALIMLAVTNANTVFDLAEHLRKLFKDVSEFAKSKGASAKIPVGLRMTPIDNLTDDDYDKLAAKIAERLGKTQPT